MDIQITQQQCNTVSIGNQHGLIETFWEVLKLKYVDDGKLIVWWFLEWWGGVSMCWCKDRKRKTQWHHWGLLHSCILHVDVLHCCPCLPCPLPFWLNSSVGGSLPCGNAVILIVLEAVSVKRTTNQVKGNENQIRTKAQTVFFCFWTSESWHGVTCASFVLLLSFVLFLKNGTYLKTEKNIQFLLG